MGVKMTFFGLKQSEDLENWAAHPTKNSQEYHLPPPPLLLGCTFLHGYYFTECERLCWHNFDHNNCIWSIWHYAETYM